MKHNTEGLARPCSAHDLFLVSGGLQCGNCLATDIKPDPRPKCQGHASDGPCPLFAEKDDTLCWVHRIQAAAIERYRNAVAEKSRAEEYRRTAVQYMDTHWAINRLNYWTQEVQDALKALRA